MFNFLQLSAPRCHSHLSPSAISVESDGHLCISVFNPTGQLGFILMTVSLQWQAGINIEIQTCVGVCEEVLCPNKTNYFLCIKMYRILLYVLLWFTSVKNCLPIFTYSSLISQATTSPFSGTTKPDLRRCILCTYLRQMQNVCFTGKQWKVNAWFFKIYVAFTHRSQ